MADESETNKSKGFDDAMIGQSHIKRGTPEAYEAKRKRSKAMVKRPKVSCPITMGKAVVLKGNLDPRNPSFIKSMLYSHVVKCFWLRIPSDFSKMYLPDHDIKIILEGDNENGLKYEANFLAGSGGLSGGWRGFALAHKLREGDVLVFQLVRQYAFKVYIVRANNLDSPTHAETALDGVDARQKTENLDEPMPCLEENHQIGDQKLSFESDKDHFPTEIMGDSTSFGSFMDSDKFSVVFNGFPLDSYLSFSERVKYHELCCARKSNLHEQLLKSVSHKFAAEIISETVGIVDAVKGCSPTSHDLEGWKKKLEAFKLLGMDVAFLLHRLRELSGLVAKYHECDEANGYSEVITKENHLNEKILSTETVLKELKEVKMNLQSKREGLDAHFQKLNEDFKLKTKTLSIL